MKPLRIGIVGSGFNAKFHIRAFTGVRDALIAGVASPTAEHREAAAQLARDLALGPARTFATTAEMAADAEIDALWINTRNDVRLDVMQEILRGAAHRARPLAGVACEKPLARTLREAEEMLALVEDAGIPHGYLENQVFAPALARGKEVIWRRAVPLTGRPYLARAAEEHSGPHEPWFWQGAKQGGGVLNDMMCHSLEAARFLLTEPGKPRSSLRPLSVSAQIASLKWTRPTYRDRLHDRMGVDYGREPAEDFARASVTFEDDAGRTLIAETTASWCYVGPGLRLSFELLGPEYSMVCSTLQTPLQIFLSRNVRGQAAEDLLEKQNAEQGTMPVLEDEAASYGYVAENRHMVRRFLAGEEPELTFVDGVEIACLLAACYRSAETGRAVRPEASRLRDFTPAVARGAWRPEAGRQAEEPQS